jgi:hypothetical protein
MNFDLNIENYTKDELIQMFDLPNNFDRNIIDIKETKLRDNISNNREISNETKLQTLKFITEAKNIILKFLQKQNPTNTIEKFKNNLSNIYHTDYELKSSNLISTDEHMVQTRKEKPYVNSSPSEFFSGIINPLSKRTIKKNLNIDTRFRENYFSSTSSNFNLSLPLNINNVVQMQLSAIELPTTFYVISKQYGNNFFRLTVNTLSTIVTIPSGNYDQTTIMTAINHQLFLLGAPYNLVAFVLNLTGGTTGTGQTLVGEITAGTVASIELDFQTDKNGNDDRGTPLPLKLGWLLGFRNGNYVNNLNYVSEGILDVSGPNYIYLVLDDYNNNVNNNFYSAFNSSILNKNILARISLQANPFNVLQQNNLNIVTTPREYFGPINLQTMNVQLLDEYGRILDLNNMDFSFCITLTTAYDL